MNTSRMTTEQPLRPKAVAETKRTPLENFVDRFPIDLAKRTLETDLAELLKGGDLSELTALLPNSPRMHP